MNIFIYRSGAPEGPLGIEEIRNRLVEGSLSLEDTAWMEGHEGYLKVKDLPGLKRPAAPPVLPPPLVVDSRWGSPRSAAPPVVPLPPMVDSRWGSPRLQYEGEGGEFFKLNLVNILLTLVTFGIYAFWAKAKVFQFHWRNTRFMEETLDYHATGKELFVGFLKGMLLLAPPAAALWWFALYVVGVPQLMALVFYFSVLCILPFIAFAKWKFLLARTSWRNIRMQFTGRLGECYLLHLKGLFLTGFTLGFYYPWFRAELDRYLIGNTFYGTERFGYHGKGGDLLPKYVLGVLLSVLTFGIYAFWFQADLLRYKWDNTSVQGIRFRNTIAGGDLFGHVLLLYITIYFTLGIAFPWAMVVFLKMKASRLSLMEAPDLGAVAAAMRDRKASSIGDGLGEAAEAIGDFLGG